MQPIRVENVLRLVAGVANVCVFGVDSSITGQLVACRVVREPAVKEDEVRAAIREAATQHLAAYERPRVVEFTDEIDVTDAGKVSRRTQSAE